MNITISLPGVLPMTSTGGKMNLDGSFVMENQDADSQLRFGFIDPPLARCKF